MSPSEVKGLGLGIRLLRYEPCRRTTQFDGHPLQTKVYARFESPPMSDGGRGRAHVLHSYSKSRAGAWRHAIRWLRQLQKGKLK